LPLNLRRSYRIAESAYLTLVACRRVEAGHAGPAGGAAFAPWTVLRPWAYACLCPPFRAYPPGCQRQVRSLGTSVQLVWNRAHFAWNPTAWAIERGQAVAISEAHVWTRHSRAMETWYERLRGARTTLQGDPTLAGALALRALKLTYSLTISGFNSPWQRDRKSPLYRPDWRHLIIAQANANLSRALHKMDAAGYTPVAVHKDAVYLMSDEPDPVAAGPPAVTLGTGRGPFKVQDAAIPLDLVLPAFDGTRGGLGTLLKLLKPLRERTAVQGAVSGV